MTSYVRNPLVYTWLVLLIATAVGWWLGAGTDAESHQARAWSTFAVLLLATIKCRLVIRNYMEVRFAPTWLRLTCDAWLLTNFGMFLIPLLD